MIREAQRAGLHFDPVKLKALNCAPDEDENLGQPQQRDNDAGDIPDIEINPPSPDINFDFRNDSKTTDGSTQPPMQQPKASEDVAHNAPDESTFLKILHHASTKSTVHDVLIFGGGETRFSVMSWWILEILPFRRLDLRPNGSWQSIRWPLPRGKLIVTIAENESLIVRRRGS